jgi:(1->4)-alpha-D-glucan 1-alpha-D-glucosylmutase
MKLTDYASFDRLCAQNGIIDAYYDIRGVHHVASVEARCTLLKALGFQADSDAAVHTSLEQMHRRRWQEMVAPVTVYRENSRDQGIVLNLDEDQLNQPLQWFIRSENGASSQGSWGLDAGQAEETIELNGKRRSRLRAMLPADLGRGYHSLELRQDGATIEALLVVAPDACYLPEIIQAGGKPWGISLQLYALRSRRNWGIGDFTDLQSAIRTLAPLGIDSIGLNPLHALFSHLPENASPYSPTSRDFINPLYLDIESIEDFHSSEAALQQVNCASFQHRLQALRDSPQIDYSGVCSAKLEVLKLCYQQFQQKQADDQSARVRGFREFQANGSDALYRFALFEALQSHFHQQDSRIETWQQWPQDFQAPDSNTVARWATAHQGAIEFHQYLQWQAELQLSAVQQKCAELGMQIGLYNDLAVGNERFSSQCWAAPAQYALDTGIGAPPDDFSPAGQSWGLPPLIPHQLRADAYGSFIRSLRANMQHAGALRIDHVMGLMRLYWVPANHTADQGTYVSYPFDDLLGILALESHRNQCLIIGEDLGTVPNEVRHALWVNNILSYRILMFEKNWDNGSFRSPADYPSLALCASGSHDLPTLRGFWSETDLDLRDELKLYPNDEMSEQQRALRRRDRAEILAALSRENLIDADSTQQDDSRSETDINALSQQMFVALQRFLARSEACLMMVQLEDILGQTQQINVPGTIAEYPNWRHKIPLDLEDWSSLGNIEHFAATISQERARSARQE